MSTPMPTQPGFYWAKWRMADEGTDPVCLKCGHKPSEWEDNIDLSVEDWAPVEVVVNCLDETNPEYLKVQVGGVAKWQSPENFVWGPEIVRPA